MMVILMIMMIMIDDDNRGVKDMMIRCHLIEII